MAQWQGPALYVYNDSVFKEADFRNLSRIGQASKMQRIAATGRFGLGVVRTVSLLRTALAIRFSVSPPPGLEYEQSNTSE